MIKMLVGSLLLLFSLSTFALDIAPVLPRHVNRVRFVGVQTTSIRDQYNSDGMALNYTAGLNRTFTAKDFAAQNKDFAKLYKAVAALDPQAADNLVGVNTYADSNVQIQQMLLTWEYGLTDTVSLGLRVPVVHTMAQVHFSSTYTNNSDAVNNEMGNSSKVISDGLKKLAATPFDTAGMQQNIFTNSGYEAPHNFESWHLGDIEFGDQYMFIKKPWLISSLQSGFRAPTGARPDYYNPFDPGSGGGVWGFGLYEFNDFYPTYRWTIGLSGHYGYFFPDHFTRPVPKGPNDPLPNITEAGGQMQPVDRQMAPEYYGMLSTTYKFFHNSLYTWTGYQYYAKGRDSYTGPTNLCYSCLEEGTDVIKHTVEVGAGYSSIPDFLAKKQKMPYEITAQWDQLVAGQNTPIVSYFRFDLMAYF